MKQKRKYSIFEKGDFIITDCGSPAFVYEKQTTKDCISIYAFGLSDEWESEYPDRAKRIDIKTFFDLCEQGGYSADYVQDKMKQFKI